MEDIKLLRGDDFKINEKLTIKQLTINQIIDFTEENGEEHYFNIINLFLLRPFDVLDKLADAGIDYDSLSNYDLFINLFYSGQYNERDFKALIGDYNFKVCMDNITKKPVLRDKENKVIIDEDIYNQIRNYFIKIHNIKLKPVHKAGNDMIKKFRIKQKRKYREKHKNDEYQSQLLSLVSSLMAGTNGSVTFFNVWDMSIYQASLIMSKTLRLQNYSNVMMGIYTGNISLKDVSLDTLDWTTNN